MNKIILRIYRDGFEPANLLLEIHVPKSTKFDDLKKIKTDMEKVYPEANGYTVLYVETAQAQPVYRDAAVEKPFPPFFPNRGTYFSEKDQPCLIDEFYKNNPHTKVASISCTCPKCSVRCGVTR